MRLEDHFRETLRTAVANEPPVHEGWERLRTRARRERRVRFAASLAAAAAVIAAALIVIPKLGTAERPQPFETRPPSPSPSQTVAWDIYRNEIARYMIAFPPGWTRTSDEGHQEIRPPGTSSLAKGEPTFAVDIALESGAYRSKILEGGSGSLFESIRPDGVHVLRVEDRKPDGSRTILYLFDWSGICDPSVPGCPAGDATLQVIIRADTGDYWAQHGAVGEEIAASIRRIGL